jgi:HAE1 family hydrophobic/amphiphilic exporter-1
MALGLGEGAELRTPMAVSVISGLLTSTALTLIVIPVLYRASDRAIARLRGNEPAGASPEPGAADELPAGAHGTAAS